MKPEPERFVFPTQGVCPPEIHFHMEDGVLKQVRFVGGGCPGNALLVSRLLEGMPLDKALSLLDNIPCRNDTSCPDQLRKAIVEISQGRLKPAGAIRVFHDAGERDSLGFIGGVNGDAHVLSRLILRLRAKGVAAICCMGNLTGPDADNAAVIRTLAKEKIPTVQGDRDRRCADGRENGRYGLAPRDRDWLLRLPQAAVFQLGASRVMAFYGGFVQTLAGYSDYDPYALEMNMVCGLTDFMENQTVFPALEAMTPQFQADVIIFGQTGVGGHWRVGGKDFVSLGAATGRGGLECTVLRSTPGGLTVETLSESP